MKLNKEGKDMWLRTQNSNKKLKENAQTHDIDGSQALPVLNTKNL